jgi:hypothetical protein
MLPRNLLHIYNLNVIGNIYIEIPSIGILYIRSRIYIGKYPHYVYCLCSFLLNVDRFLKKFCGVSMLLKYIILCYVFHVGSYKS